MRFLLFLILCSTCATAQVYHNPIIHADYSDPDAIRVGDDYYMIASSFNAIPGLPILHSKDLVNWQLIGYALKNNLLLIISQNHNTAPAFGHLLFVTIKMNFTSIIPILILGFI